MDPTVARASGYNGSPAINASQGGRIGEVKRVTKETNQLASHELFDVRMKAVGDIHIDDHHTNEDVALAIGTALLQALGDRKGTNRFGDFSAPLVNVSLDLSRRPYLSCDLQIPTERVRTYDTQLVEHFFQSLVNTSGMTLHIRQRLLSRPLQGLSGKQHNMIHPKLERRPLAHVTLINLEKSLKGEGCMHRYMLDF